MQNDGLKPQTIESHSKILRFLAKHVQLNDPEAVRLFVANQQVSSGRKENEVDVFSSFARYHTIAFSEPRYSREETLRSLPRRTLFDRKLKPSIEVQLLVMNNDPTMTQYAEF